MNEKCYLKLSVGENEWNEMLAGVDHGMRRCLLRLGEVCTRSDKCVSCGCVEEAKDEWGSPLPAIGDRSVMLLKYDIFLHSVCGSGGVGWDGAG